MYNSRNSKANFEKTAPEDSFRQNEGEYHKQKNCNLRITATSSPFIKSGNDFIMAHINDIVLIYHEDKPLTFARIENILPDSKPDWYHVKLLMLQVPLQVVTWILRDVYINGETFRMNGKAMRLERVVSPVESEKLTMDDASEKEVKTPKEGKILSLKDFNSDKDNERNTIVIDNNKISVGVVQIASRLVRRIDTYIKEGNFIKKGSWFGMIRFGSQVDLIIPASVKLEIKTQQQVYAGKTIVGIT